ncbi:MAG: FAD-dependent oxidoreductase [Chromatiaceae bacterium]
MDRDFQHVVIGAGVSGLGIAHLTARRDIPTLILDQADRIGGCINSQVFPDAGGFWTETGGHTCFNSYGHLLDILRDLGMMERLRPRPSLRYSLWRRGKRRSILSALHPIEMAISLPRLFATKKSDRRVIDYYGNGLGRKNYRDLFGPAFRAVICQDPDEFPAELLFRRKPRRKEVARSFTFPAGLSEIAEGIAAQPGLEVRTRQGISAVRRDGSGFQVLLEDGSELSTSYLTLAVPPDAASTLLSAELPELGRIPSGIAMAEVESVALCVPREDVEHLSPLAGLIAVDDAFYSMVSRDYLDDPRYRGFAFHFRPGALSPEAQIERACQAIGVTPNSVVGHTRAINRLPALRVGHPDRIRRIDAALADTRLAITGNWFLGVSIEDCLTRSYREFQRLFGV